MRNPLTLLSGLILCGVTTLHADFDITDFATTEVEFTYPATPSGPDNTAAVVDSLLQVTPGELSNVGAVWVTDQLLVTNGFTTIFEFEFLTSPTGGGDGSGDGLAFVLQNESLAAVGNHASAIGYGGFTSSPDRGINKSLAIEFDDYRNGNWGDADANHISVHTMYEADNTQDETAGSIGATSDIPHFGQGSGSHVVKIEYASDTISIYFEDMAAPVLEVTIDLEEVLIADSAWVGFTGSGGAAYQIENVISWSFTTGGGPTGDIFRRGDVNADGDLNIADAIALLSSLFGGGSMPPCQSAADANDDGTLNIADAITILGHLFGGAGDLPEPFGICGEDPTEDTLPCDTFPPCP